jgi:hypothetical protein
MSVEALGGIFSGPNRTGSATLIGIGVGDRYSHMSSLTLQSMGFYNNIQSGFLDASAREDVSVVLFFGDNYNGGFVQITWPENSGESDFWCTPTVKSIMLIGSAPGGSGQTMLSFKDIFQSEWDAVIDAQLGSDGWRRGEPSLGWDMFTDDPNSKWLNSSLGYLKVHQDLTLETSPWPWDYDAWLEYWIYLYPSGGNVRAFVPQWRWWVDSGVIHDSVEAKFKPKVDAGASALQDDLNSKLQGYDALTQGRVNDVFLLPGRQGSPPGSDVHGNTGDDVTIVIAM